MALVCTVDGCGKSRYGNGLCRTHYTADRRARGLETRYRAKAPCKVDGCGHLAHDSGYCATHAGRWRRNGDPLKLDRLPIPAHCSIPGCDKTMGHGGGRLMCPMHYQRWRLYGDPLAPNQRADLQDRSAQCSVAGCGEIVGKNGALGMCAHHAGVARRARNPEKYRAIVNIRRRRLRDQEPPWADRKAMKAIDMRAQRAGWDVDHILPIADWSKPDGDKPCVSGLHCEANMRIMPHEENRGERRRLERPDDIQAWLDAELSKPELRPERRAVRQYVRMAPRAPARLCSHPGCQEKHYGRRLCRKHYRRQHELGTSMECKPCEECGEPTSRPDARFCCKPCQMKWHRKHGCYAKLQSAG